MANVGPSIDNLDYVVLSMVQASYSCPDNFVVS